MKKCIVACVALLVLFSSCSLLDFFSGKDGADGKDGSRWLSGAVAPGAELGAEGDFYLDTASSNVYSRDAAGWLLVANIQGAIGAPGSAGANGTNGTDGANGTNGTDGVNGADGAAWHTGSGAPAAALGALGDFYLDTDDGNVYRKAAADAWGAAVMNVTSASIRASGTVAPGASLSLNLSTITVPTGKKLTYTGQFVKDGIVYDAAAARSVFPGLAELYSYEMSYNFDEVMSSAVAALPEDADGVDDALCAVSTSSLNSSVPFLYTDLYGLNTVDGEYGWLGGITTSPSQPDAYLTLSGTVATPVACLASSDGNILRVLWASDKGTSTLGAPPGNGVSSICLEVLAFTGPDVDGYYAMAVDRCIWLDASAMNSASSISACLLPDGRVAAAWSGTNGESQTLAKVVAVDIDSGAITPLASHAYNATEAPWSFPTIRIASLEGTTEPTLAIAALGNFSEGQPCPYYDTLNVSTLANRKGVSPFKFTYFEGDVPHMSLTSLDSYETLSVDLAALDNGDFVIAYNLGVSGSTSLRQGKVARFGSDGTRKSYNTYFGGISGSPARALGAIQNYIDLPALAAVPEGGYALGFKSNPNPSSDATYNRQCAMIQAFGSGDGSLGACELSFINTSDGAYYYRTLDLAANYGLGGREVFMVSGTTMYNSYPNGDKIGAYRLSGLTVTEAADGSSVSIRNDTKEPLELRISVQR